MNIYLVMIIGGFAGIILHSFKAVRDIANQPVALNLVMPLKSIGKQNTCL